MSALFRSRGNNNHTCFKRSAMRKERHLSQAAAAHICNYKFCKHESTIRQEEEKNATFWRIWKHPSATLSLLMLALQILIFHYSQILNPTITKCHNGCQVIALKSTNMIYLVISPGICNICNHITVFQKDCSLLSFTENSPKKLLSLHNEISSEDLHRKLQILITSIIPSCFSIIPRLTS